MQPVPITLSPLILRVRISVYSIHHYVIKLLAADQWFPPVSYTKKQSDHLDIAEILRQVALGTITLPRIASTELVKMWYDFGYVNKRW